VDLFLKSAYLLTITVMTLLQAFIFTRRPTTNIPHDVDTEKVVREALRIAHRSAIASLLPRKSGAQSMVNMKDGA